jgi:GAF domain
MATGPDTFTVLIAAHVGVESCAITLMGYPVDGSDETAAELEDWQFVLSDGPAIVAFASRLPVEYPDSDTILDRCPLLAGHLAQAGVLSVASFPIMFATTCVGTITLYSGAERLRRRQRHCAEQWARHVSVAIGAQPDTWANRRSRVAPDFHVATGLVMASCNVAASDAGAMIQARAFVDGTPLRKLCHQIVHQDLVLALESWDDA